MTCCCCPPQLTFSQDYYAELIWSKGSFRIKYGKTIHFLCNLCIFLCLSSILLALGGFFIKPTLKRQLLIYVAKC